MNTGTALIDSPHAAKSGSAVKNNHSRHAAHTTVLVGDEHAATRSILRDLLRQQGYEIAGEATGWGNFLPMVKRLKPDIICLDYAMPGADIPHFLKDLDSETTVIIMSSDLSIQSTTAAMGVAGFLGKPFSQTQVIEELARINQACQLLRDIDIQPTDLCTGLRIVLADDSSTMRELLKAILEGMGAEVVAEATDGQQAIDMAAQHQPDIICLDVEMPTLSGIDALARIHADHPGIKAVMVTSRADRSTVMRAISLGACGYILKPYKPEQLKVTMRSVIRYAQNSSKQHES